MRGTVWIKVRLTAIYPDGGRLTQSEVRRRVKRLLDEKDSATQPTEFYLTEPVVTEIFVPTPEE